MSRNCWLSTVSSFEHVTIYRWVQRSPRSSSRLQGRAGTLRATGGSSMRPTRGTLEEELLPSAPHTGEQYANNLVEADHGRLKARLRPMRD